MVIFGWFAVFQWTATEIRVKAYRVNVVKQICVILSNLHI